MEQKTDWLKKLQHNSPEDYRMGRLQLRRLKGVWTIDRKAFEEKSETGIEPAVFQSITSDIMAKMATAQCGEVYPRESALLDILDSRPCTGILCQLHSRAGEQWLYTTGFVYSDKEKISRGPNPS